MNKNLIITCRFLSNTLYSIRLIIRGNCGEGRA
jgi:hypothetical protein